ncbi:MAG: hypothetical protein MUC64_13270 [Rubritepida sp.]|nr:hypothetical protein [Rubritepida sp.]
MDRQLAARVPGIDVILTAHTHDALPRPVQVGTTLLLASGAAGKFVGRLDLDVRGGRVSAWRHALIPVFRPRWWHGCARRWRRRSIAWWAAHRGFSGGAATPPAPGTT